MGSVKFSLAVAALAVSAGAAPVASVTPVAMPLAATPPAPRPLVRNGGVHRVNPAASAASASQDDRDVRTTAEDGRTVTRNAHERNATTAASSPNN